MDDTSLTFLPLFVRILLPESNPKTLETDFNQDQKSNEKGFLLLSKSVGQLAVTILLLIIVLIVLFSINSPSKKEEIIAHPGMENSEIAAEDMEVYQHGKDLYKSNCSACHGIGRKLIGPDLANITAKREKEWLYQWIRNNTELRESGDEAAIAIYEEYNGAPMNNFPQLTDADIDAILMYIDERTISKNASID